MHDIEDGSVDLLHVDGRHFYEDVKEDFESWVPKLSPRAVVLFHDTTERGNNFGVWKYWEEISQLRPSFNFSYQHGLGVIFWGTEIADDLKSVVDNIADKAQRERMINYFALHGEILWLQQTLDNSNAKKDGAHLRTKKYFKYWMKLRLLRILSKSAPNLAANIFIRFFSSAKNLK